MIDALKNALSTPSFDNSKYVVMSLSKVGGREAEGRRFEIAYCDGIRMRSKKFIYNQYRIKNCLDSNDPNYYVSSYEELEEIGKTNADIMWILKYTNIKELFPIARAHPNKTFFYSIDYIKYIQDGGEIE